MEKGLLERCGGTLNAQAFGVVEEVFGADVRGGELG